LSNEELLTILAEASNDAECVQPHLRKIFENIARIEIETDNIQKFISAEKEVIKFGGKGVKTTFPVEEWLRNLEREMQNSVNKFLKEAVQNFKDDNEEFKRHEWVMHPSHTAQAVSVVGSIKWCEMT
jgi:dynein heavy chain